MCADFKHGQQVVQVGAFQTAFDYATAFVNRIGAYSFSAYPESAPNLSPSLQPHSILDNGQQLGMSGVYRKFRRPYRKGYKRRRTGALVVAKKALRIARKIERKSELKVVDTTAVGSTISPTNTGLITDFTLIGQGDGNSNRDGTKISPVRLQMIMQWVGDVKSSGDIYRTVIFIDRQQIASTPPTYLQVFKENGSLSQYNHSNLGRFKILYDQCFTSNNAIDVRISWLQKIDLKLSLPMLWVGSASSSISKNGLYMINVSTNTGDLPLVSFSTRFAYTDT